MGISKARQNKWFYLVKKRFFVSQVMVPCNSDELAELMITQLCLGRGGCVSVMTDVVERTQGGTTFIRPLRDVTSAEIATALRLENVEHYALLPELKV
ncbi:hypothetical protein ANCCAN_06521, partial [Ancylostoma caninum]